MSLDESISNPQNMDKEDELLEMTDVMSLSDSSEKSKRGVSLKLTGVHFDRLTTQSIMVEFSSNCYLSKDVCNVVILCIQSHPLHSFIYVCTTPVKCVRPYISL